MTPREKKEEEEKKKKKEEEEEVVLCQRLMSSSTNTTRMSSLPGLVAATTSSRTTSAVTTSSSSAIRTSPHNNNGQENLLNNLTMTTTQDIRPECLNRHQTTVMMTTSTSRSPRKKCYNNTCSDQTSTSKKRKLGEEEEEEEQGEEEEGRGGKGRRGDEQGEKEVVNKCQIDLEKYKRLLLIRKRLFSNLAQRNNIPLFYLYGDLLLIPKYKWGSGVGVGGGRRRRPLTDSSLEASSQSHQRSSLVQVCPDSQSFEEGGFTQEWFSRVMLSVVTDLNKYGVCVVDDFLGPERADHILGEVRDLHQRGVFCDGQVVSRNVQDHARGRIRGDKITWVTGGEPNCGCIGQLVSLVDKLVANANKHQDAGELAKYNIAWRTQAMVACYPGEGAHYVKHVDNPDGDGRCITAIYYINKDWRPEDGGVLRIYPEGSNQVAEITPVFDRMLFFWSDRRNPHEVLPANFTSRYAITVWYFDQREREEYLSRRSRDMANT